MVSSTAVGKAAGPRTELTPVRVVPNVADLRDSDEGGAGSKARQAPVFPKKYVDLQQPQAQTTEANRKETTAGPTDGLVPKNTVVQARQAEDLLPRSIASEMARARPLGSKASNEITGKAEPREGRIRHDKEQNTRTVACSLKDCSRTVGVGTQIERGGSTRREEHRASSGARRPVGRAGPGGQLDAP